MIEAGSRFTVWMTRCAEQPYFALEFEIGKIVKQKFERGKFDLTLRKEPNEKSVRGDESKKLKDHFLHLKKLQKSIGLKDEISFEMVLKTMPTEKNPPRDENKNHQQFYSN